VPAKKIDKILTRSPSSGGTLQRLLRNGDEKAQLTSVLKHSLPKYLSDGVRNARKSGTILHVECLNSSIATNIRFESDSLRKSLSCLSDFGEIDEIKPFVGKFSRASSDP
jgi:hypothetical protein